MLRLRNTWPRVGLCLVLAVSELFPAAPAIAGIVQSQVAVLDAQQGARGVPVRTNSTAGALRFDLPARILTLPVAQLRWDAAPSPSEMTAPKTVPLLPHRIIPVSQALDQSEDEKAPRSSFTRLARTATALNAVRDQGGERTGKALDALFTEDAQYTAPTEESAVDAEDASEVTLPQLLETRPAPGRAVAFLSPRIAQLSAASGRGVSIQVGVTDLLNQTGAQSRAQLSLQIARETFQALGWADPDGGLAAAFADFLRDMDDFRPVDAVFAYLDLDDQNHLRLQFERADGSRRVLFGQFLPGTAERGASRRMAFVLMRPIEVSAAGLSQQDHPGYWREYSGGDRRLEWSYASRTRRVSWGPWARRQELRDSFLAQQSWRDGRWQDESRHQVKTVLVKDSRSWLGHAGDKLMQSPVLGHVLRFCDNAAVTALTGLMIIPHSLVAAFMPSHRYSIEAGGDFAKNPLLRLLKVEPWVLGRLDPVAQQQLMAEVRLARWRAVIQLPAPVSPELFRMIMRAEVGVKEAAAALRGRHGVGTFGRRLIEAGAATPGWKGWALGVGGVIVGALEGAAETVCNPILWVMLGLDQILIAAAGAPPSLGLHATEAVFAVATALWWGPWLISAADHIGRLVQMTVQGEFGKDYFKQLSKIGTDALYYFVIP